jgi:Rod binding domain-containing protein
MRAVDAVTANAAEGKAAPQPRLVKAAHEFEAQLMKELLKPMTADDVLFSDGGDPGPGGILGEFGAEALGRALSEHGGLGIASSILRSLSHGESPAGSALDRGADRALPGASQKSR